MANTTLAANVTSRISHSISFSGWVTSPNGRGTLDIIQSCIATIFLCTYSAIYLCIKPDLNRLERVLYKTKWVLFTLFCPELMMGMAAEQWRSARQSVQDFRALKRQAEEELQHEQEEHKHHDTEKGTQVHIDRLSSTASSMSTSTRRRIQEIPWTSYHAFFVDMGGIHLQCPDFKAFPINSYQFYWLVEQGHIDYPNLAAKTIQDKNKADLFARGITLVQVSWFTIQCVARGVEHLGLTTLELSTIAFATCTLHAAFFWRNKPLDVDEPIILDCAKPLVTILASAGQNPSLEPWYTHTPLDFLQPAPKLSYVEPFFASIVWTFNLDQRKQRLPITAFNNAETVPPRGLLLSDVAFSVVFMLIYFGIHLAAWGFYFPTVIEQNLWRATCLTQAITVSLFLFAIWPGNIIGRFFFGADKPFTMQQAAAFPRWISRLYVVPVMIVYFLSRAYIVLEGFVGLRRQPVTVFESVNWWIFVPHL